MVTARTPAEKDANARRNREYRYRRLRAKPCEICRRVHPGTCKPEDERSIRLSLTLPGRTARRLRDRIGWGERSAWIAGLVEAELDRLDTLEAREEDAA